jgi:hypothetical protein
MSFKKIKKKTNKKKNPIKCSHIKKDDIKHQIH